MKRVISAAIILLMAAGSAAASEPIFQCSELQKLVDAAGNHFAGLGTSVLERETAADLAAQYGVSIEELGLGEGYEKVTWVVERPLSGADGCEIVDVTMTSESSNQRQTGLSCRYAAFRAIPDTLGEELENCLAKPLDPESDNESLTIWVDRVESGEGYSSTALELESNIVEGLTIGVVRSVCLNLSGGGCDDGD